MTIRTSQFPEEKAHSTLYASSIGALGYEHLRVNAGRRGKVHSLFGSALNIVIADRLLSILPQSSDRGPFNAIIPLAPGVFRSCYSSLRPGDDVEVAENRLELKSLYRIDFGNAEIYNPPQRLSRPVLGREDIMGNLSVAIHTGLSYGNLSGLGSLLDPMVLFRTQRNDSDNLNIYARAARPWLRDLVEIVQRTGSEEDIRRVMRNLIGLGPGLTPSGDDVLAGLEVLLGLYSINTQRMESAYKLVVYAVGAEVDGRTTRLSEEFLRQAAVIGCNESLMKLCSAMLTGGIDDVKRETRRVLGLGGTSGTDVVLGVVLGAAICSGFRGEPAEMPGSLR